MKNGCFAYIMYILFHKFFDMIPYEDQLKQLKRTFLCTTRMPQHLLLMIKCLILCVLINIKVPLTKRKRLYIDRLNFVYTSQNEYPNEILVINLDSRSSFFRHREAKQKFLSKVSKLLQT